MAFIVPVFAAIGGAVSSAVGAVGGLTSVLGGLSAVAGLAGTAISVVGAMQQGEAASKAARWNALADQQQARAAQDQSAFQASQTARLTRLKVAAATAGSAENGVAGGSTDALLGSIQDTGNLDAMIQVYDGSVRATGYNNEATLQNMAASQDMTAGYIGAASKAFGGLSTIYHNS